MSLAIGFYHEQTGRPTLASRRSTREQLSRTEEQAQALDFDCASDAIDWLYKLEPKLLARMVGKPLYLFAIHDLTIPPIGEVSFVATEGTYKDRTPFVQIDYREISQAEANNWQSQRGKVGAA